MEQPKTRFGAILIVEDLPRFWRPLKTELRASGLFSKVTVAQSVPEAEFRFQNLESVSAVLMDACLSGEKPDTLELTRELRETYAYDGIIIAMSRDSSFRGLQLQAGCSHESTKEDAAAYLMTLLLRSP